MVRPLPLLFSVTLFLTASCGEENPTPPRNPVLVVGIDGLSDQLLLHFIRQGHNFQNFKRLLREGTGARLETLVPTWSPCIWTSVATGKVPAKHGITNFAWPDDTGELRLFTSGHRATRALWNIATENDRVVNVVGWWNTWPVEEVNGVMLSQTLLRHQLELAGGRNALKGTLLRGVEGQVHPPASEQEYFDLAETVVADINERIDRELGTPRHTLDQMSELNRRFWRSVTLSFRADNVYRDSALAILENDPEFDLMMVYFGAVDVASHRLWRMMQPELYEHPPSPADVEDFGSVILNTYWWMDRALGSLLERVPENTNVIVLSDHGFYPVNRKGVFDPDDPPEQVNSGDHQEKPPALLMAIGPDIQPGGEQVLQALNDNADLPTLGSILDVGPTVLRLLGIPPGRDMDGSARESLLSEAFRDRTPIPEPVPSHDDATWRSRIPDRAERAREEEGHLEDWRNAQIEVLKELGYLQDEGS